MKRLFFITAFVLSAVLVGFVSADDDFFAPEEPAAENKTEENASPVLAKSAAEPSAEETSNGESVLAEPRIPADALLILRTVQLARLNEKCRHLLKEIGLGPISPLEMLKLSAFGKAVLAIDIHRPAAVVYLNDREEPFPAILLPVSDFSAFASALGAEISSDSLPSGTVVELKNPAGASAALQGDWAVVFESKYNAEARPFIDGPFLLPNDSSPRTLKNPDITVEITPLGFAVFERLIRQAKADLTPVVHQTLQGLHLLGDEAEFSEQELSQRAERFIRWPADNLRLLQFDLKIARSALVTALALTPKPDTPLARQIGDTGGPLIPTSLEGPEFLKIVPVVPAPLSGQIDITPETASSFDPPFDRLRHVEYSFAVPSEGELLAESWCFFLEVDDSEAFMRELIVPKAQLIGSKIGADKLGEIGAQVLGNLATRRQSRGRRPLLGSPEDAAAVGEQLGANIGANLGMSVGEQEAMKIRSFDGFPMYTSDLVLYTKQMKEIRARQRGEQTRPPIILDGSPTLRILIGNILSGLESGSLEGMIQSQFDQYGAHFAESDRPLLARRNLTLRLDETHLLMVPGDENLLRAAKDRWIRYTETQKSGAQIPAVSDLAWQKSWDLLCREMTSPTDQILRSATQFSPVAAKQFLRYVRQYYAPKLPEFWRADVPKNLSEFFSVSTTSSNAGLLYGVAPNDLIAVWVAQRLSAKNKK